MSWLGKLFGKKEFDPTKCMICSTELNFETKISGFGFGDAMFEKIDKTAYKCRNCGTMICMNCAKVSRCRKCGGNTFDRAIG